jgi:Succinylglutamate desuccinylase / Aspartoacylase family
MNSPAGVKDSVPRPPLGDPGAFIARAGAAAGAAGFRLERYGEAGGFPLLALTRRTPGPRPRIYVSTGIHGDEPAGPLALVELLEAGVFDRRAVWLLCPLLNPAAFVRGTRENPEGVDLNRDYRGTRSAEIRAHRAWLRRQPPLDLVLCLHEDWEAAGYYLYEQNPRGRPGLAEAVLAAAAPHCPVDPSPVIDGREARGGIIRPSGDPFQRDLWPESIYLRSEHTDFAYTLESPSGFPLGSRIAAHRAAVGAALAGML